MRINDSHFMRYTVPRIISRLRGVFKSSAPPLKTLDATSRKLLIVSHDAHLDGAPLLILHIAKVLRDKFDFEITFLLLGSGPLREDFSRIGPVIDFSRPDWRAPAEPITTRNRRIALRQLRANGYRHSICNTTVSGTVLPILHAEGFETLVLIHELPELIERLNLSSAAKAVAKLSSHVVFPADAVRDRFPELALIDKSKISIRPQGLYRKNPFRSNQSHARAQLVTKFNLDRESVILLGAGPADRRKGIDIFCQVATHLLSRSRRVEFVWLGDDEKELTKDCRAWLNVIGFSSRIHFSGLIKEATMYLSHIAAADIFLLTSREDPFPSVVLDAMEAGVPVIGFEGAGGFSDVLAQGAGLLVPLEDRVAMSKAVESLLDDPTKRSALGIIGQNIIDSQFDFDDYVKDLIQLAGLGGQAGLIPGGDR